LLRTQKIIQFCLFLLAAVSTANAQESNTSSDIAAMTKELDAYRRILLDWGGLAYYGSDNTELKLKADENRVVFLGDEITENWARNEAGFFPAKPYINRGITRQTAAQMLVRFRQDVIDLKPKVVIIEAGTNDLASVMGPSPLGTMSEYFMSMVELAKVHDIGVVLASVTPVCNCFQQQQTQRRPPGKIIGLNRWLKDYAASSGSVYLDYYSVLAEGKLMKRDLTVDGLVPNAAGYRLMAPLAEKAIAQALSQR
jgi:lysophospholipase L1-like esterase